MVDPVAEVVILRLPNKQHTAKRSVHAFCAILSERMEYKHKPTKQNRKMIKLDLIRVSFLWTKIFIVPMKLYFSSVNNTAINSPIVVFFLWLVSSTVVGCTGQLLRADGWPQPDDVMMTVTLGQRNRMSESVQRVQSFL